MVEEIREEYARKHFAVVRRAVEPSSFTFDAATLRDIIRKHKDAVAQGWCHESGAAAAKNPDSDAHVRDDTGAAGVWRLGTHGIDEALPERQHQPGGKATTMCARHSQVIYQRRR